MATLRYLPSLHLLLFSLTNPTSYLKVQRLTHPLLALELVLLNGKGHLKQILLLLGVRRLGTRGHRRAGVATGVHHVLVVMVLRLVQHCLNARLRERPCTRVQRLLLGPHHRLGVGVRVQVLLQLLPREGVQLLNTRNGDIVDVVVRAVLLQSSVHLARAQNHTVNLVVALDRALLVRRVGDDPGELRVTSEVLNARAGNGVTEQRLGEEDDEG